MKQKSKGVIHEFKEFIARGNVIDMAVGIIVGAAFTAIVNSFVNELVMPVIGYIIRGINFADFKLVLASAQGDVPEVAILYGSFLQQLIVFFITAFVVFLLVKVLNRVRRKKEEEPAAPPVPAEDVVLLAEIRDLLRDHRD